MENKPWQTETVITLLKKNYDECGNSTALYLGCSNTEAVSFANLYRSVGKLQNFLMQDFNTSHIGILGENSSEWFIAFLGILSSGCVAVPIEKELPVSEVLKRLIFSDCKAVFLSEDYMDYKVLLEDNGIRVLSLSYINATVKAVIKEEKSLKEELKNPIELNLPATILFTSGTSGTPKAVVLSHKGLISNGYIAINRIPQNDNRIGLMPLPLYHAFSLSASIAGLLVSRLTIHFTSVKNIMKDVKRVKPSLILAVTAIVEMIYTNIKDVPNAQIKEIIGDEFIGIICGGAYLSSKLQDEMCKKGIPVIQGYGMTECSPIIALDDIRNGIRIGSVGRALDCCAVSVSEPDENGIGELTVCGDNLMIGYYKDYEATEQIIKDGILYTGDLGYVDDDGYIFITGRKKNLIILSNGKNVSPEELEGIFDRYPYIHEVCVYEKDGKIVGEFYLNTEQYPEAKILLKKDIVLVNRMLPKYKNIVETIIRNVPFERNCMMKTSKRGH